MKSAVANKKGVVMIWVMALSIVIFVIGISVLTAASLSSGAALRYRDARRCYSYSMVLSDALTDSITGFSYENADDPWRAMAQSVYDVSIQSPGRTIVINDPAININAPGVGGNGLDSNSATINITLENQKMKVTVPYSAAVDGHGEPGEDGYIAPKPERPESCTISFVLIIDLHTSANNQEYVVRLKYNFDGVTEGGEGSGKLISGTYKYLGMFE